MALEEEVPVASGRKGPYRASQDSIYRNVDTIQEADQSPSVDAGPSNTPKSAIDVPLDGAGPSKKPKVKSPIHLIPPHTPETVDAFLRSPFGRCAWIIPVRGCPGEHAGWGCTSASVLRRPPSPDVDSLLAPLPAQNSPLPPEHLGITFSDRERRHAWTILGSSLPSPPLLSSSFADAQGTITWTVDAIRDLWAFLLQARDAKRWGLVGVSFILADPDYRSKPRTETQEDKIMEDTFRDLDTQSPAQVETQSQVPPSLPQSELLQPPRDDTDEHLASVDYIKLFLDSRVALEVRAVLDVWRYQVGLSKRAIALRRLREEAKRKQAEDHETICVEAHTGKAAEAAAGAGRKRKREESDANAQQVGPSVVRDQSEPVVSRASAGSRTGSKDVLGGRETKAPHFVDREDVVSFRMLRGARLVLLDAVNRPVLTC